MDTILMDLKIVLHVILSVVHVNHPQITVPNVVILSYSHLYVIRTKKEHLY